MAGPGGNKALFDRNLSNLFIDAIAADPDLTFDAIIVDEGQDFPHEWLSALELALKDPSASQLHVFLDNNQRIYRRAYSLVDAPTPPFPLTRNLRNSIQIFGLTRGYYAGDTYVGAGPEGQDVEFIAANAVSADQELAKVLGRLTKTESVPLKDIAVLACDGRRSAEVRGRVGSRYRVEEAGGEGEGLVVETIARFKGLERPVVILMAADDLLDEPELAYVGMSRAMIYLVVIGSKPTVGALKKKYEDFSSRRERP
jgi:superfamily I DNA/RNA helicase